MPDKVEVPERWKRLASHTPGPWHYQEISDVVYTHIIRGPNEEFIGSAPQESKGRARVDAHLMAAAPQLLEELARAEARIRELKLENCPAAVQAAIKAFDEGRDQEQLMDALQAFIKALRRKLEK